MWKFSVIFVLTVLGGLARAEDETQPQTGPSEPSLYDIALCYAADSPYSCVKDQLGRALDTWETQIEEKRHDLLVEADEESKESNKARGLSDDDEKTERPSDVITAVDRGLSAIGKEVLIMKSGRDARAMRQVDDANDFNDDFTLLDGFSRVEAEGNVAETGAEKEAKGLSRDDELYGGYGGYGGGSGKGKGKKGKKGKKGLMKIFFIGALIKAKVEMLLKILSFHLQLKFFAIALASFIINLARFWVDLKKAPAKVVYHEHSQHQHHYDEHDDWGSSWKRQTHQNNNQEYSNDFAHRLAYSSGYTGQPTYGQGQYQQH